MKPLVLHIRASNFVGGPEKQILGHIRSSLRYRHAVVTFLEGGKSNPFLDECRERRIPVAAVRAAGPWDIAAIKRLRHTLDEIKPDIVCTHGYKPTVMAVVGGMIRRYPTLAFSRGETGESRRVSLYEWIERKASRVVRRVVCVSEAQKVRLTRDGVESRRINVVHNAVSQNDHCRFDPDLASRIRKELGASHAAVLAVSAGRLSPEKGHRYLIEAIAGLKDLEGRLVFAFCGDGICRDELVDLAERLGVSGMCRFMGFRHDLKDIFHAMDLLVLPSITEGLPNVILEAFACARPVIATAVGGVPEVVENGSNGILVPPRRPDMLARAIRRCVDDLEECRKMGMRGREKVAAEFSFEKQAQQLEAIYDEVLSLR